MAKTISVRIDESLLEAVDAAVGSEERGRSEVIQVSKSEVAMPLIKPISDLRNKANEVSELARKSDEPIFITKNGEGDMVVMSMAHYSKLQLKLDLFSKLAVAQAQRASGDKGRTLSQVMKDLQKKIREAA